MEYLLYWLIVSVCTALLFNARMDKLNVKKGGVEKAFLDYMSKDDAFYDATEPQMKFLWKFVYWGYCLVLWPMVIYWVGRSYLHPEEYQL